MSKANPVNKDKKGNIKCEYCKFWTGSRKEKGKVCMITNEDKNYYNSCKCFEWRDNLDE